MLFAGDDDAVGEAGDDDVGGEAVGGFWAPANSGNMTAKENVR
jgi:hypothetical protein